MVEKIILLQILVHDIDTDLNKNITAQLSTRDNIFYNPLVQIAATRHSAPMRARSHKHGL